MIEIKDLKKFCGVTHAADGISFKLNNGEAYGVLDLNNETRGIMLALLSGATKPDAGFVRINGFDTSREPLQVSRCIGYMPKNLIPYPDMTPEEYLIFIAEARDIEYETGMRSVHELLDEAELRGRKRILCTHLSIAERKRLCLAQALMGDPEILVLDEPTADLSERDGLDMLDRLDLLSESKTLILGSASLTTLRAVCKTILVLSDGKLIGTYPAKDPSLDAIFADLCAKNGIDKEKEPEHPSRIRKKRRSAKRQTYTPQKSGEYELIEDDGDEK